MSLKTKLYLMASLFGIAASNVKKGIPTRIEGLKQRTIFKDEFSGHRFVKVYPDMNKKNTERKEQHRAMIKELADQGICWTPFGLFSMQH